MDYSINKLEHLQELNSLPQIYPIEMAIKNDEIVVNISNPHNTEQFFEFLTNANNGVQNKVRIIRYGIDNPELAIKSILEYNGEYLIFTEVGGIGQPKTYYGNEISLNYDESYGLWIYNLITYDDKSIYIFSILDSI